MLMRTGVMAVCPSPLDSKAIVDGNLKLILGLIWTLILHYSISMPMWDEEEEADDGKQKTPKQRLLGWIQNKLPELPITNFNRDWQTGQALGALVDSCAPGEPPHLWGRSQDELPEPEEGRLGEPRAWLDGRGLRGWVGPGWMGGLNLRPSVHQTDLLMVSEGGVSSSRPVLSAGLCPDWDQWDQSKPVDNAREAMQQADDWLGIPQVPTQFPCSCLRN